MKNPITIETDLFEHREVKPHFINPCCFGEDFAAWIERALTRRPDSGFRTAGVIQEDYGWGVRVTHGEDWFWIAISYVGDGPRETTPQWIVSVSDAPTLHLLKRVFRKPDSGQRDRLRETIRQILASEPAIRIIDAPSPH